MAPSFVSEWVDLIRVFEPNCRSQRGLVLEAINFFTLNLTKDRLRKFPADTVFDPHGSGSIAMARTNLQSALQVRPSG
jgi:hypothetical protein